MDKMYLIKKLKINFFIFLLIIFIPSFLNSQVLDLANLTIVIDAGHGGKDLGCLGHTEAEEKDIALDLTKRLQDLLIKQTQAKILLTRGTDKFVFLNNRASFANNSLGNIFISLHANASFDTKKEGLLIYYYDGLKIEKTKALEDKDKLYWDFVQNPYIKESKKLAKCIADEAILSNIWSKVSIKFLPLNILQSVAMPAVLIETEFITSPIGERRLLDDVVSQKIVECFSRGINKYILNK